MSITGQLFALRDETYAQFQRKLIPTVAVEKIIGVRVPEVRKLAQSLKGSSEAESFMKKLPHDYYDEDMLHGLLLSEMTDYQECVELVDCFLPYVDNWAVCDTMSPKVFKKHKSELMVKIREWASSQEVYTCRFGMEMLMTHYLDKEFRSEYLEIPAAVCTDEYYVKMMVAWYFSTALAKQWDSSIGYIEHHRLDEWIHRKTIQKACESYRVTDDHKAYLKMLK